MVYFNNDYSEGCHPKILSALEKSNFEQTPGYGCDDYCARAAARIRQLCEDDSLAVHFLVGGTQANLTVIDAALRPHQAAVGAVTAHINVHETGAVEATGHKVLGLPSADGKLTASQVEETAAAYYGQDGPEHMVQPKLVYISNPTELGTIYSRKELEELSAVCKKYDMYLFLDGARLGYGLTAKGNDVSLADLARLCDVFYIGGTKVGALFGEAVVIRNPDIGEDFRFLIKQHGGMLAKGRLLGVQFLALLEDNTYFEIAGHANTLADQIRQTLDELGYAYLVPGVTNQIFPILPDALLAKLGEQFTYNVEKRVDESHQAVRFCTGWATTGENVDALCAALRTLSQKN